MAADVDEVIAALRERLGAETDADLARKLRINKSTISSWRARGNVPDRFHGILRGDNHQSYATAPQKWGDQEQEAFNLALFRLARIVSKQVDLTDYRKSVEAFSGLAGALFWSLMIESERDLAEDHQSQRSRLSLLIYDDIEAGDASIERDLQRLARDYKSSASPFSPNTNE